MVTPQKVHGADLSHHNPDPDLVRARKAGLGWLYHKATEGSTYRDPLFARRRKLAADAGVPFGAYHFARPDADGSDAEAEARFFMRVADPQPGDMAPMLDLEVPGGHRDWAIQFMKTVEDELRARGLRGLPVHYGPDDFGPGYPYVRWVPRYSNGNDEPKVPWDIWQFSNGVFGRPNELTGLGHVDLNTMRPGLRRRDFRLRAAKPPRETADVMVGHVSLQFSDTDEQHTADITKIFRRAKRRGWAWITGTEAGPGSDNTAAELMRIGANNGYFVWCPAAQDRSQLEPGDLSWATDAWVAVRSDLLPEGARFETHYDPVIPGSEELKRQGETIEGKWAPKGLVWVRFPTTKLGTITIGAAHYLTRGRKEGDQNYERNVQIAHYIGDWAVEQGKGRAIVFYGGDQNLSDRDNDTFFGAPLTSLWDETADFEVVQDGTGRVLKHYEPTGHGNIDVIASYNDDGRVEGMWVDALPDDEFKLETDHFMVEGEFRIQTV